ncbi:sulfatase [Halobacteriales archaeon QS_1_68_17]|nr:MAG: sulfatase [Halobacteriales archaeon QS_1_68_17]
MTASISNVVLVTVDSLRADALDQAMPVAAGLADDGAVFERAFAHGNWTPFSFPSLLASRPVFADTGEIGVTGSPTLAAVLSKAGVATGGFNAANGFLTAHWGYDEGFDEFESFVGDPSGRVGRFLAAHPTVAGWAGLAKSPFRRVAATLRGDPTDRPFADASRLTDVEDRATAFLADAEEPFFLWVHYMDAHTPYVPAPRYLRAVSGSRLGTHRMLVAHARTGLGRRVSDRTLADLRTLYRAAVRQVDAGIGRLLGALDDAGIRDETAVVVTGDHGEEFMEHGHLAHYPKLYDELIHVPLVVDVPGIDGTSVDHHAGLADVPPTVCDLLGVEPADRWTGRSLLPAVHDDRPADEDRHEPILSVTVRGEEVTAQPIPRSLSEGDLLVSARADGWIYIENAATGDRELYHRPSDPDQQCDRSRHPDAEAAAAIDRLRGPVREHADLLAEAREDAGYGPGTAGDSVRTRLEALGYR